MAGRSTPRPVRVAISLGDPSGIGPEIVAAALARPEVAAAVEPVIFGDAGALSRGARAMGVPDPLPRIAPGAPVPRGGALVEVTALARRDAPPGRPTAAGGEAQGRYLEAAIAFLRAGHAGAICTAPISKAAIHAAGWNFPGHTELLAERFGAKRVVMMLAGERLRVALATTHVSIRELPDRLTAAGVAASLAIVDRDLRERLGLRAPRIAVCGLNPHAGEGGLFGDEEARVIAPAIARAGRAGIRASGPYPADTLFPRAAAGAFDAVLAMYHDQGLVALKLLHFDTGVNVTLGLPIVRTSPDHGVAYDLAGKGRASARSMAEALLLAARMGRKPRRR
jgi:4-hydroxythreonine-4-phosphate dehydrogenase